MTIVCELSSHLPKSKKKKGRSFSKLAQTYRGVEMAAVGRVSRSLLFVWTNNFQCQHSKSRPRLTPNHTDSTTTRRVTSFLREPPRFSPARPDPSCQCLRP